MKYQDIINHLNSLHLKSTKGIIKAMEQLLPEFQYVKTGDAYCVYARYPFKREGHFALAFTIKRAKGWDGNLQFHIKSSNNASMLPKGCHYYYQRVPVITDTDQDLVRCKRQEAKDELLVNSPFSVDYFDHSKVLGTRTFVDFRPLLFCRSDKKKELSNFRLPYYELSSMLDRIKSHADPYSRAYDPQLFWKELSEVYETASDIQKKDLERRKANYREAILRVEEYMKNRMGVRIF